MSEQQDQQQNTTVNNQVSGDAGTVIQAGHVTGGLTIGDISATTKGDDKK
ncbi:hypothetical protein [Streptomyces sp. XC 2026]|nr:hypothetical protein [Streptomyces sp. XC 2026]QQN79727.1 hypothetical protein IPZ77_21615 [Streptomyces sp. XC 2026]QQN80665.1 hypothetical protein IPZ77_27040 [Streptomyces sp. XC 2026]